MAYVNINGIQYEKELLDMATAHTTGAGESQLAKDEVMELLQSAQDGPGVTDIERRTLNYIRNNFDFTDAAARLFDREITKL